VQCQFLPLCCRSATDCGLLAQFRPQTKNRLRASESCWGSGNKNAAYANEASAGFAFPALLSKQKNHM
jgi:hypothetical protein